jgi:hypothetical protein
MSGAHEPWVQMLELRVAGERLAVLFDPKGVPRWTAVERGSAPLQPHWHEMDRCADVPELEAKGVQVTLLHAWPRDFVAREPWRALDASRVAPVLPHLAEHGLDLELLALERGLRRLVKREGVRGRALADRWRERGLAVAMRDRVLFASTESHVLEQALLAEAELGTSSRAAVELGTLLGYPECCTRAFARLARADDFTASARFLPPCPTRPASALGMWLDPGLRLCSHFPCGLECDATRRLGRELLAILEEHRLAERWRALAQRVHAIDDGGRQLALEVEGDLVRDGRAQIVATSELEYHATGARVREVPELDGKVLIPHMGGARTEDGSCSLVLVADHRGAQGENA